MNEEEVKVEEEVKKVIISVTADSAKTESSVRRNSTGKASTSSDEKILPHYLRASTKSCHDFCKYGKSHVFEAKKRLPIRRSFPQSSSIRDEHKAAEVSAPRERRTSSELKVKTTSWTDGVLSDKVKGIKKLVLKEKESSEAFESMKLQTPLLSNEGEESSKGLASIETATPIPIHQIEELSEASETAKFEGSSPTEKRIISQEPTTPLTWSEGSSDGSECMELDSPSTIHTQLGEISDEPSAIHTPKNQLGKLSDEPLGIEISTPSPGIESIAFADVVAGSKPTSPSSTTKSLKAGSAKSRPSSSEERSSEKTSSVKLKTPSPYHRSGTATENRASSKNLKVVEGKKSELTKPVVSDRTKAISKKRIESTMQSRIIKKSPSPSLVEMPKIVEQKSPLTMKKVMSVSPKIIKNKVLSSSNNIGAPSKPSISLKQKVPVVRSTPALMSSRKLTAQKDLGNKMIRSVELSKPRASLSTKLPVGREKVKNQVKVGTPDHTNEKVEKTLYVIEPRTLKMDPKPTNRESKKNKPTSSSHSPTASSSSSSFSSSLSRSTLSESKRSKPVHSPKRNEKRKPIRTTIHSEPKLPSPHNLKFQRGKTVSPNTENNSPRKLKFRQAKGVSETLKNKEAVRKNFMRRRVSIGSRAELTSPAVKAPAVVLKHQDVQEKKDIQGLLNHVIEETASKLVETRKSKVKALVGAFETVISLQESRVASATS